MFQAFDPVLTPIECNYLKTLKNVNHHDDDGGHHIQNKKNLSLTWVARNINNQIAEWGYADILMKLYILNEGAGEVAEHTDEDYINTMGYEAKHSILIYLNDDYEGGETMFGSRVAPKVKAGGFLIFPHSMEHSGLKVTKGTKYILKTDMFSRLEKAHYSRIVTNIGRY